VKDGTIGLVAPAFSLLPPHVGMNMQKVHFTQQEARKQGKRVYRVDIDFKNAFTAMS